MNFLYIFNYCYIIILLFNFYIKCLQTNVYSITSRHQYVFLHSMQFEMGFFHGYFYLWATSWCWALKVRFLSLISWPRKHAWNLNFLWQSLLSTYSSSLIEELKIYSFHVSRHLLLFGQSYYSSCYHGCFLFFVSLSYIKIVKSMSILFMLDSGLQYEFSNLCYE